MLLLSSTNAKTMAVISCIKQKSQRETFLDAVSYYFILQMKQTIWVFKILASFKITQCQTGDIGGDIVMAYTPLVHFDRRRLNYNTF